MIGSLTLATQTLAFDDLPASSNPSRRYVDWKRTISNLPVSNPQSLPHSVDPNSELTIFDGTRVTGITNTTEFTLTLSPLDPNRYRFTWSGTGTNPAFRTDRGLTLSGNSVAVVVNANQTISLSSIAGSFTAVQVGDIVFIPNAATGDTAGPFNILNGGYWSVLSKDGTSSTLGLARFSDEQFSGASETVTVTSNIQLQAFSTVGLQIGDAVDISAGFSTPVQKSYSVIAVNPKWFEVTSTSPIPVLQTAVPGASGMQFYTNAKRFIRIEADQECVLRLNGSIDNSNRITPWVAGDKDLPGEHQQTGIVWKLVVVNRTSAVLNLQVISAE